jgi:hypothetical protein
MAERKSSSWVKAWTNVIVRSRIHFLRMAEGEPRLVGQGVDLEMLDWRPADGRHAVELDGARQVCLGDPAVGYVQVDYELLRQQVPWAARRAALTNAADLRPLVEYMALHGWERAERSAMFAAQAKDGKVWIGVLKERDSKASATDRDFPEWALGYELFECQEPCGDNAALGYARGGDLGRFKWLEEDDGCRFYPTLFEFDPNALADAAN